MEQPNVLRDVPANDLQDRNELENPPTLVSSHGNSEPSQRQVSSNGTARKSFFGSGGSAGGFSHGRLNSPLSFNFGKAPRNGSAIAPETQTHRETIDTESQPIPQPTLEAERSKDGGPTPYQNPRREERSGPHTNRLAPQTSTPSSPVRPQVSGRLMDVASPKKDSSLQPSLDGACSPDKASVPDGSATRMAWGSHSNSTVKRRTVPITARESAVTPNASNAQSSSTASQQPRVLATATRPNLQSSSGRNLKLLPLPQPTTPAVAAEQTMTQRDLFDQRTLDVSFIGNAEVENQLAATMMDLAGHIQQQNSSRQRKLEELTEELTNARACIEKQSEVIAHLRESSQVVIQALVGQREKVDFNQERIDSMQEACKLYQMTVKNLGALVQKAEESRKMLEGELDTVAAEKEDLSSRKDRLEADLCEMQKRVTAAEQAAQKELQALNAQHQALGKELAEAVAQKEQLRSEKDQNLRDYKNDFERSQTKWNEERDGLLLQKERVATELENLKEIMSAQRDQHSIDLANKSIEIMSLEARMKTMDVEAENTISIKEKLEEEIEKFRKDLGSMEEKIAKANESEAVVVARLEQTKLLLESKQTEYQQAQLHLKTDLEEAERKLRDARTEVARIQRQSADEQAHLRSEIATLKEFGSDMDSRHAENITALEQIRQSQSREIDRMTESNDRLQKTIIDLHDQRKKIEYDYNQALEEAQKTAEAERVTAQQKWQQGESARESLETVLCEVKNDLSKAQEEKIRMKETHAREMKIAAEEHEAKHNLTREALDRAQNELQEAILKHAAAEAVTQELHAMKPKQADLVKRIKELEKEATSGDVQLTAARRETTEARCELNALQAKLVSADRLLNEERERYSKEESLFREKQSTLEEELSALKDALKSFNESLSEARTKSANEVSQLKKQFESTERRREAEKSNLVAKIATLRNEKESSSSVTKMLQDERNALQSQVISKIEQNEALLHEVATLRSAVSDMEKKLMLKPPTLEANAERQSVQTSQRFEDSVSHIFSQIETMAEPSEGEYGDATDMLQELLMDAGKADDNTAAIGISDVNPVPTKKSIATKRKVLTIEDTDDDDNEEAPDSDKRRKKESSAAAPLKTPERASRARRSKTLQFAETMDPVVATPGTAHSKERAQKAARGLFRIDENTEISPPKKATSKSPRTDPRLKIIDQGDDGSARHPTKSPRTRKDDDVAAAKRSSVATRAPRIRPHSTTTEAPRDDSIRKQVKPYTSKKKGTGEGSPTQSETSVTTTTTIHTQRTRRIVSTKCNEKPAARPGPVRITRANTATRRQLLANTPPEKVVVASVDDLFGWPSD